MKKEYKFIFNKLVRDFTIDRLESVGIIVKYKTMDDNEYRKSLDNKLIEESKEVSFANDDEIIGELADILELIYAYADFKNINFQDINNYRIDKNKRRGTFSKRIFIEKISVPVKCKMLKYFKNKANEYQEIIEEC